MPEMSPEQINRVLQADPMAQDIAARLRKLQTTRSIGSLAFSPDVRALNQQLQARARQLGLTAPAGRSIRVQLDAPNQFVHDDTTLGDALKQFGPMAAGVLAGGALGGAFAGGAGGVAAGAGGGAGAGAATAGTTAAGGGLLGTLTRWAPFAGEVGNVLANASASRAAGRAQEADFNLDAATRAANARNQALSLDLQQREFLSRQYQQAVRNALLGGLLPNVQDVTLTPPAGVQMGQITGGLKPSSLPNRAQIGANLTREAMLELMNPTRPGGITSGTPTAPPAGTRQLPSIQLDDFSNLAPPPSGLDKGLNIGSFIGTGLGLLDLIPKRRTMPVPFPETRSPLVPRNPFAGRASFF